MNLFKETEKFVIWFQRVLVTFLRIRPWTTTGIVAMSAASRITNVLTTFLPLKVVLLAGSTGVPRYFRFFMDPDHKEAWIFVLALGAVACYAVSVWLDSVTGKLSRAASEEILREAETIPILNNQEDAAGNYYAKFSRILADGIFVLAAVLGGLLVNFRLFVFIPLLLLCFFSLSALFLRAVDRVQPSGIAGYIQQNLNGYTKILSNVVFFSGFIFLLIPFLISDYSNILAAILSIIIIRQVLGALTGIVRNAVQLGRSRHEINALIFRNVQLVPRESPLEKAHRELFHKEARRGIAEQELSKVMRLAVSPEVSWLDPMIPGLDAFLINVRSKTPDENRCFLQQVFPPKHYQRLEHELFLFRHVPRARLCAPELVSMFFAGPFQCLICDYGSGKPAAGSEWQDIEFHLTRRMWSCRPPDELVRIYSASAPLLHHRFNEEIADRLEIAVDTEEEMGKLHRFRTMLPRIKEKLQLLPLYVYNCDLNRNNTVQRSDGGVMIISWGRWTLEPLGAGLPHRLRRKVLTELLEKVRTVRKDIPKDLPREDVLTAAWCFDLENLVNKKRYKAALQLLDKTE